MSDVTTPKILGRLAVPPGIDFTVYTVAASTAEVNEIAVMNLNNRPVGRLSKLVNNPQGIAVNAAGDVFYADTDNNVVRKMTRAGIVTVLAGSGTATDAAGTGSLAGLNGPIGLALSSNGANLFVTTKGNKVMKIVVATGVMTVLAGSGDALEADGTGAAAKFKGPRGICTDDTNVYVADSAGNTVRQVVIASGVTTTLAGALANTADAAGTGAAAGLATPRYVCTDATNVFVTTAGNHVMKVVIASGVTTVLAGSGTATHADGTGTAAGFVSPQGIIGDGTNLFVACASHLRKIVVSSGVTTTLAGNAVARSSDGNGSMVGFNYPTGLAINAAATGLLLTEPLCLRAFDLVDNSATSILGDGLTIGGASGKTAYEAQVDVSLWLIPSGETRADERLLTPMLTMDPGIEKRLTYADLHMATGDKIVAKATHPGASIMIGGTETVPAE